MSRKFRHVNGFFDGTDYVELCDNGKIVAVNPDKRTEDITDLWTLEQIERNVKEGVWEEIISVSIPTPKISFAKVTSRRKENIENGCAMMASLGYEKLQPIKWTLFGFKYVVKLYKLEWPRK